MAKTPHSKTNSNKPHISSDTGDITIPSPIHILEEDMATISRSKLESLKGIAQDDRMKESVWNMDRVLGTLGEGLLCAAIGARLTVSSTDIESLQNCKFGITIGLILFFYGHAREYFELSKKIRFRTGLAGKIEEIIKQMDTIKAEKNESQASAGK